MRSIFWIALVCLLYSSSANCSCLTVLTKLHRLFKAESDNHFYTASGDEANNAVAALGFARETSPGWVPHPSLSHCCRYVAVHRLQKVMGSKQDHLYTTNQIEINSAVAQGYKYESVAFYCSATYNSCGASVALYRFLRGSDHFYTHNYAEGAAAGTYEGLVCYIWP